MGKLGVYGKASYKCQNARHSYSKIYGEERSHCDCIERNQYLVEMFVYTAISKKVVLQKP